MDSKVIIGVVVVAIILLAIFLFDRAFSESPSEVKRLRKLSQEIDSEGIKVDAIVKRINRIQTSGSGTHTQSTYVDMVLDVTLPDGTNYEVTGDAFSVDNVFSFDVAYAPYVTKVNAVIPIIVHPTEHDVIKIDHARLMRLATGQ